MFCQSTVEYGMGCKLLRKSIEQLKARQIQKIFEKSFQNLPQSLPKSFPNRWKIKKNRFEKPWWLKLRKNCEKMRKMNQHDRKRAPRGGGLFLAAAYANPCRLIICAGVLPPAWGIWSQNALTLLFPSYMISRQGYAEAARKNDDAPFGRVLGAFFAFFRSWKPLGCLSGDFFAHLPSKSRLESIFSILDRFLDVF